MLADDASNVGLLIIVKHVFMFEPVDIHFTLFMFKNI